MHDRLRDTNEWYTDRDPLSVVDMSLVQVVRDAGGERILDLGCGLGGYSATLNREGFRCSAVDINERYVESARGLGVDARMYDGVELPFADKTFDTTFAIEVLEHVADPGPLLAEVRRVTGRTFIATVPNCTQSFGDAGVVFDHMLDTDHKNFFSKRSLAELLGAAFDSVDVSEIVPVNAALASAVLPRQMARLYRFLLRRGVVRPTHYFRLLARCLLSAERSSRSAAALSSVVASTPSGMRGSS